MKMPDEEDKVVTDEPTNNSVPHAPNESNPTTEERPHQQDRSGGGQYNQATAHGPNIKHNQQSNEGPEAPPTMQYAQKHDSPNQEVSKTVGLKSTPGAFPKMDPRPPRHRQSIGRRRRTPQLHKLQTNTSPDHIHGPNIRRYAPGNQEPRQAGLPDDARTGHRKNSLPH